MCDETVDLTNKQVLMFSYGSGCAASMFVLRFSADYKKIASKTTSYKQKLAQRIKVDPKDYDKIMAARQEMFGKKDDSPKVCISLSLSLTHITNV